MTNASGAFWFVEARQQGDGGLAVREQDKIVDSILLRMHESAAQYHRLVLLVGGAESGKTSALQAVHSRTDVPICDVGVTLSAQMLELSETERATRLPRLLAELTNSRCPDGVLVDNIEVLFDPSLLASPLELLKSLSKTRTVVASWPGYIEGHHLIYAKPGHPEHRRYDVDGLPIVEMDN